jgi:two-component system, LytTR family, sensor kinase
MNISHLLEDKRSLFWILQAVGWGGWASIFYLGVLFWGIAPENYTWYLPLVATIGMLLTLPLRAIYRSTLEMPAIRRIFIILGSSYIAGALWMMSRRTIFYNMFPSERKPHEEDGISFFSYFDGTTSAFWVMLVWSGLYFGIKYYMLLQEEKQRVLKVMSMAHEAQLKMLRYQLNPHFLFNTLNAISTLILDKDTELANTMVTRLSRFLRYSLDNDPMQKVTVAEEMESLKLYLDIEKVRFDDRLQLHFNIEQQAEDALMPSLLLQPLVENSIKYAIAQAINGGNIAIDATTFGGELLLSVTDDGPGLDLKNGRSTPKGGGVGITNTRERLKELYGDEQSLRLSTTEPHGLTINIRLPLQRKETDQK